MSTAEKIDDIYRDDAADDIELDDDCSGGAAAMQKELNEEQQEAEAVSGVATAVAAGTDDGGDNDRPRDGEVTDAKDSEPTRDPTLPCAHCGQPMGTGKGPTTKDGPIHVGCVLEYKFLHQPRCHYCDVRFLDSESTKFIKDEATGRLYHLDCRQQELKGVPYVRPSKEGEVRKFAIARSKLSRHNWKTRYFVLCPMYDGIRYFEHNPHADPKKVKKENSSADSTSNDDTFDRDADPKLAEEHAKKAKGLVPLDRKRSRLITHPAASLYKVNSSAASVQNDVAIIFFDGPDSNTERRLLFQCKDKEEKLEWVRALEGYIHTVDDPKDYGAAKDSKK